jgi:hypothetical protein
MGKMLSWGLRGLLIALMMGVVTVVGSAFAASDTIMVMFVGFAFVIASYIFIGWSLPWIVKNIKL